MEILKIAAVLNYNPHYFTVYIYVLFFLFFLLPYILNSIYFISGLSLMCLLVFKILRPA